MKDFDKIPELNLFIVEPEDRDICAIELLDIDIVSLVRNDNVGKRSWFFLSGAELKDNIEFYITPTVVPWDNKLFQWSNYWYKNISASL